MMKTETMKQNRIEIRVDGETKKLIEKAARILGESISAYVVRHSLEAAMQDIREHETLELTGKDGELFYSLITNPPKPNDRLVELMHYDSQEQGD